MTLHYGASYYPPQEDPQDWDRDLGRMAEAGLTVMRTAELLATWGMIETEPGKPDFA
jgi:beta-galactosidase GanA